MKKSLDSNAMEFDHDFNHTINSFRTGNISVKEFVFLLDNNSDFSSYYRKLIDNEVSMGKVYDLKAKSRKLKKGG